MTDLPLPLRSSPAPFRFMGEARLVNLCAEEIGKEQARPVALVAIPGQTTFAEVSDIHSRGMLPVEEIDRLYSVHDSRLYEIARDGSATVLPGVIAGSKPVIMERGPERFMQKVVTIDTGNPGMVNWINHNLPAGTPLRFSSTGSLPGLDADAIYYVAAAGLTANSFTLAATVGGSPIAIAGDQSGTHTATRATGTYQIVIVSDIATYVVEDGVIYYLDLPEPANSVAFADNRWVYFTDSGRYYWSALNDARTVEGTSFATAESRPDGGVRVLADGGELILFGTRTVEIKVSSGDPELPFQAAGSAVLEKGCASKMSVVSFDNAPHWLGHECIYYRLASGYNAQRISDHAVERDIARVADKTSIRAYTYSDRGHSFLVLTCAEWTWVLDAATQLWHQRRTWRRRDWRAWPYAFAWGRHIVGNKGRGVLMEMRADMHTENGKPIRAELVTPDMTAFPDRLIFSNLIVNALAGSASAGAGEPYLMLDWSDDGGATWSHERWLSLGREGEHDRSIRTGRLGTSGRKGRRFRMAVTADVARGFLLADVQARRAA
jgi:hypothetical protein